MIVGLSLDIVFILIMYNVKSGKPCVITVLKLTHIQRVILEIDLKKILKRKKNYSQTIKTLL